MSDRTSNYDRARYALDVAHPADAGMVPLFLDALAAVRYAERDDLTIMSEQVFDMLARIAAEWPTRHADGEP